METPLLLRTDAYKPNHHNMFPEGLERSQSNFTARGSRIEGVDAVVYAAGQYLWTEIFTNVANRTFFGRPKDEVLREYTEFMDGFFGPNSIGIDHMAALWDLGHLPLEIWSVPEGTPVPLRIPFFTIESTVDGFGWLQNYFESCISNTLWMPCTSATTAWRYRKFIDNVTKHQGSDPAFAAWQGHDFSYRGMASDEAASLSGLGHLISFTGTDTISAVHLIQKYYGSEGLIGSSVPATEHSVMCAGGMPDERETYNRLIKDFPTGILSIVSDTWDYWGVLLNHLPDLKEHIMQRDGKLVIRPDSGDPVKIICGDPDAPVGSPEWKGSIQILWEIFGGTTTAAGFKILDSHIGLIYGDSITYERLVDIANGLAAKGFGIGNVVLGVGSFTYQYVTRDTHMMAMKMTWAKINGVEHQIYKDPKTDVGSLKKSAKGRIMVFRDPVSNEITMQDGLTYDQWEETTRNPNALYRKVWADGELLVKQSFDDVRETLLSYAV